MEKKQSLIERIGFETLFGGVFGVIAIGAAVAQMVIGGFSADAIAGCVKDVAGTLIVVMVMILAMKQVFKSKPKNLTEKLEKAVEDWGMNNSPFIFKTLEIEISQEMQKKQHTQGFVILQHPEEYSSLLNLIKPDKSDAEWQKYAKYGNRTKTGKFFTMPSYEYMTRNNFEVVLSFDTAHFKGKDNIQQIIESIISNVNNRFPDFAKAVLNGKAGITLSFNLLTSDEDIDNFVETLDFILSIVKVIT